MSSSSKSNGAPTKSQLASATKPLSLTPLLSDLWLLDRLMYKSTYTTGRMPHMHKLAAVKRALRRLTTHIRLDAALATILVHKHVVDPADVAVFLKEWIKVSKLLPVIQRVARAASLALVAEMGAGRYVAFCVVTVAIMARVERVAAFIAAEMRAPYVRFRNMLPANLAKTLPTSLDRRQQQTRPAAADDLVSQSQVIDRSTFAPSATASSSRAATAAIDDVAMEDIAPNPWVSVAATDQVNTLMLDTLEPPAHLAKTTSKSKRSISLADSDDDLSPQDTHSPVASLDDLPSFFEPVPAKSKAKEPALKPPKKKARYLNAQNALDDVFAAIETEGNAKSVKKSKSAGAEQVNFEKNKVSKVQKAKLRSSSKPAAKSAAKGKDEIDDLFGSLF